METPTFDTFRRSDNVDFSDVEKDPVLYQGVHVIWQGRPANLNMTDRETTFDLLIDYDPGRNNVIKGMPIITFNRARPLDQGRQLEVLGRIMPPGADGRINLEGIAIHQSGKLEQ
jgi:hypothetical protein